MSVGMLFIIFALLLLIYIIREEGKREMKKFLTKEEWEKWLEKKKHGPRIRRL